MPYPPAFSDPSLLPPRAADAARYFDEPRTATVFVKTSRAEGEKRRVHVLLEELGIPWELFCPSDAVHVAGNGWRAVLAPAAERNADDGEGLPFSGLASGEVAALKRGQQIEGAQCRWYARFGEAVDLYAIGMLLHQAAPGFERWFGVRPTIDEVLRQRVLADITGRGA